jgi:hypothetical protein
MIHRRREVLIPVSLDFFLKTSKPLRGHDVHLGSRADVCSSVVRGKRFGPRVHDVSQATKREAFPQHAPSCFLHLAEKKM